MRAAKQAGELLLDHWFYPFVLSVTWVTDLTVHGAQRLRGRLERTLHSGARRHRVHSVRHCGGPACSSGRRVLGGDDSAGMAGRLHGSNSHAADPGAMACPLPVSLLVVEHLSLLRAAWRAHLGCHALLSDCELSQHNRKMRAIALFRMPPIEWTGTLRAQVLGRGSLRFITVLSGRASARE